MTGRTNIRTQLFIGASFAEAETAFDVVAPATGAVIGTAPRARREDTIRAVRAATEAAEPWRRMGPRDRARAIVGIADALSRIAPELAATLSAETGKRLAEAEAEVRLAVEFLVWFAEEGRRAYGMVIPSATPDRSLSVMTRTRGPAGLLVPWNFPVSILARKLGAALAAGSTVVARPSSTAPLAALRVAEAVAAADLPPGTVNLVSGAHEDTADVLIDDPRIRTISFTGSTGVGRAIARRAGSRLAHTALELGGDAPFVVFDDADLDVAVELAMAAKLRNNGQSCIALNRLYVQSSIADRFLALLESRLAEVVLGDPADARVTLGPVISPVAAQRLTQWAATSTSPASRTLAGPEPTAVGSTFVPPRIVVEPAPGCPLERHEVFGPVAGAWVFETEGDAWDLASRPDGGLAGYVVTRDVGRIARAAEALGVGILGVNDVAPTTPEAPFGGLGQSGWGKEGGRLGLDEYLDRTYVSVRIPPPVRA